MNAPAVRPEIIYLCRIAAKPRVGKETMIAMAHNKGIFAILSETVIAKMTGNVCVSIDPERKRGIIKSFQLNRKITALVAAIPGAATGTTIFISDWIVGFRIGVVKTRPYRHVCWLRHRTNKFCNEFSYKSKKS